MDHPDIVQNPNQTILEVLTGSPHGLEAKQKPRSKMLRDDFPEFIMHRQIVPIGKPRSIFPGTILLCHKCQHATKIPVKNITEYDPVTGELTYFRYDSVLPSNVICSNKKCGLNLSKCITNYKEGGVTSWGAIQTFSIMHHGCTNNGRALCCKCHTGLPLHNPNTVLHPCWESNEGGYYQETRTGPTMMMCCQCRHPCQLQRKSNAIGETKEDVKYTLFCSEGCEHAEKKWNSCEDCIRFAEELPPLEDDYLSFYPRVQHEKENLG